MAVVVDRSGLGMMRKFVDSVLEVCGTAELRLTPRSVSLGVVDFLRVSNLTLSICGRHVLYSTLKNSRVFVISLKAISDTIRVYSNGCLVFATRGKDVVTFVIPVVSSLTLRTLDTNADSLVPINQECSTRFVSTPYRLYRHWRTLYIPGKTAPDLFMGLLLGGGYFRASCHQNRITLANSFETGRVVCCFASPDDSSSPTYEEKYITKYLKLGCSLGLVISSVVVYFSPKKPLVLRYTSTPGIRVVQSIAPVDEPA